MEKNKKRDSGNEKLDKEKPAKSGYFDSGFSTHSKTRGEDWLIKAKPILAHALLFFRLARKNTFSKIAFWQVV